MELQELIDKILNESKCYTSINGVVIKDNKGRELKDIKLNIKSNEVTLIFEEN